MLIQTKYGVIAMAAAASLSCGSRPNEPHFERAAQLSALTVAQTDNLLSCRQETDFILGRCSIKEKTLTEAPKLAGEAFEAQYRVEYSFPCEGHQPNVGVISGSSFAPFELGAKHRIIDEVAGSRPLATHDPSPSRTRNLSFLPGCRLTIHDVSMTPSLATVQLWRKRAARLTTSLEDAVDALELVRAYTNLLQVSEQHAQAVMDTVWDLMDSTLLDLGYDIYDFAKPQKDEFQPPEEMPEDTRNQWEKIMRLSEPPVHRFYMIWTHLKAVRDQAPIYRPDELEDAQELTRRELERYYVRKLLKRRNEARKFIQAVEPWRKRASGELDEAVARLREILNETHP